MLTAKTTKLDLMQVWLDGDPDSARLRVNFPINKWTGSRDSVIVYFEIEPGDRLARHTDSAEEILYVVAGEAEAVRAKASTELENGDGYAGATSVA